MNNLIEDGQKIKEFRLKRERERERKREKERGCALQEMSKLNIGCI